MSTFLFVFPTTTKTGVTGQQRMITLPWHMALPLIFLQVLFLLCSCYVFFRWIFYSAHYLFTPHVMTQYLYHVYCDYTVRILFHILWYNAILYHMIWYCIICYNTILFTWRNTVFIPWCDIVSYLTIWHCIIWCYIVLYPIIQNWII